MKRAIIWCISSLALLCPPALSAQSRYGAEGIPAELKEGNCAVVRLEQTEFRYDSPVSATAVFTEIITVLNRNGNVYGGFSYHTNQFSVLRSFSGEMFDASGRSLKKYKKQDLAFTEYSGSMTLVDDSRMVMLSPEPISYPFTVRYDYEVSMKGGLFGFPVFSPVPGYDVAVEKAAYKLVVPEGCRFNTHKQNTDIEPAVSGGGTVYEYRMENMPSIKLEAFSPPWYKAFPCVYFAAHDFVYDNTAGSMESWERMGEWQASLLAGRGKMPQALQDEVLRLTRDAASDREKVEILYDYLGKSTRYVNIALGIGGWQPRTVAEVYKNKFGDCKALSYYLKAMLAECGIESYYTVISTRFDELFPGFANMQQNDHVILQVPLGDETLWLECTNTDYPVGYNHTGIAGHDALVVRDGKFELCKVPDTSDSLNRSDVRAVVRLGSDNSAKASCTKSYHMKLYEGQMYFDKQNYSDKAAALIRRMNIPMVKIGNIEYKEIRDNIPVATINYDMDVSQYGSVTGNRIFIPVNPLRDYAGFKLPARRKSDIYVDMGSVMEDTIEIELEEGLAFESIPEDVVLVCEFGSFSSSIRQEGTKLYITQKFVLNKGEYPASRYEEFMSLLSAVRNRGNAKIALRRS